MIITVCAYCDKEKSRINDGKKEVRISHGICEKCFEYEMQRIEKITQSKK